MNLKFLFGNHCIAASKLTARGWLGSFWELHLVEHVTHLLAPPHSTPRTLDEQHNGCQLRAEVVEGGSPHLWACAMMNDSAIRSSGITRSRQRPSVAPQQLLSF